MVEIVSSLAVPITVIAGFITLNKNIKNENIVKSRITWLNDIKENFKEYNNTFHGIMENKIVDREISESINIFRKNKADIRFKFKSSSIMDEVEIPEFISTLKKLPDNISDDELEKYFFNLLNVIEKFVRVSKSENTELREEEEFFKNYGEVYMLLSKILEEFQLAIAKIEWNKIKKESGWIFKIKYFNNKMTKEKCIRNIRKIIKDSIKAYEDEIKEPVKDKKEEILSNVQAKKDKDMINNSDQEIELKLDRIKCDIPNNTVKATLVNTITELSEYFNNVMPISVETTEENAKRYIYSQNITVHPNGNDFFNMHQEKINNKNYYIETNYSKNQLEKYIDRLYYSVKNNVEIKGRDYTKYKYKGTDFNKRRLALELVTDYFKAKPYKSYDDFCKEINNKLVNYEGVLAPVELIVKKNMENRYFMDEKEEIIEIDNKKYAVSTQWGKGNIEPLIENFKKIDKEKYDIQPVS